MRFNPKKSFQKEQNSKVKVSDQQNTENNVLTNSLKENIEIIKQYLSNTGDLIITEIIQKGQLIAILYIETLINKESLFSHVIEPLLEKSSKEKESEEVFGIKKSHQISTICDSLLGGTCVLLKENSTNAFLVDVADSQGRSISEPTSEQNIIGPRDGAVESLSVNIQLLRKRINNPHLKVKYFTIGKITKTKVAMVYLDSIANNKIVEEVEKRISSIEIDQLQSEGSLEGLIEDSPFSPFPQMLKTERPDRAVSYLLEGKVNLIVDGNPKFLVAPITFFAFYQAPDDYNHRWLAGSFFRIIRVFSFMIAISLPAIYIAIVSFHSEVLPVGILYSIRVSLEFVPFRPLMEALTMQIILELLKEAAIRLPSPIAQTIGIVGGLVIGTAVVEAHLVSNTMIVVIGFTAIASFVAPISEMGTSVRLLGFPVMIAASILGFFGITLALMILFMHLCKLQSFGTPYFSPLAPFKKEDLKDTFIKLPIWKMNTRPTNANPKKLLQQGFSRVWKRK